MSAEALVARLASDASLGLSSEDANERLARLGPNRIVEAPRPGLAAALWRQLDDFVIWLLIVAAGVAAIVGHLNGEGYVDALAILAIVVLNAVIGLVQERRAENALAALQALAAPAATLIRDGKHRLLPADLLVPGDLVVLEAGARVPADLRLLEAVNLRIEEASLTGESLASEKRADPVLAADRPLADRTNMAFRGTVVRQGRGLGLVTQTGMQTQLGRIAELIQSYENEATPLQSRLAALGRSLGQLTLGVSALVFVLGLARSTDLRLLVAAPADYLLRFGDTILELFMVAVSLAIAAVPEGLPAVVTVALAIGMQRMLRRNALIRRLPAVETLGSTTVICSDKTGTLSQNRMVVVQVELEGETIDVRGEGYAPLGTWSREGRPLRPSDDADLQLLAVASRLASDAVIEADGQGGWSVVGDPTEGALVALAARAGVSEARLPTEAPRLAEIAFDSDRKRMTTLHRASGSLLPELIPELQQGDVIAVVKGAPELVLARCDRYHHQGRVEPMPEAIRARVAQAREQMASRALRVLALAYRPLDALPASPDAEQVERELVFLGLVGLLDPPRAEVAEAIALARRAGVRTIMITGDDPATALAIASRIGLAEADVEVLTGQTIEGLEARALGEAVARVVVFARVSPEHKVRIVEALKARGEIVAMTGDGVNDAPALKRANIGVAMGLSGTDVSRETADMVLTDDNYASIVAAIEEGRTIYTNIRKFVFYLLSCNLGEVLIVLVAILAGMADGAPPLLPIQLLWLNLVTDGLPALALGLERAERDVMQQPPRDPTEAILSRRSWPLVGVQALADAAATLGAIWWALHGAHPMLEHHDRGAIQFMQTVAFATLALAELLRAYTARSERRSILAQGPLTNPWLVAATLLSLLLVLAPIYLPGLQSVFRTVPLTADVWPVILGFAILPALAAELTKAWLRRGERLAETGA
ncbi:MAG: cation-translocating P-type ATPase [Chloroflexi bacterium]|nr:cation-translocating P-type ATPase [Chloroflexota bacterium]